MKPRGRCLVLVAALFAGWWTTPLCGQALPTVGLSLGRVSARHLWNRSTSTTEARTSLLVGAFVEVPTTTGVLAVRAEAHYLRRRSRVVLAAAPEVGGVVEGGVRGSYLSFPIHLKLGVSVGPLGLHASIGPTFELPLGSTIDPVLVQILSEEATTVVGVAAGAGGSVRVADRYLLELEARVTETLNDSYTGPFIGVRSRSVEVLARVGVRWPPR